MLTEPVSRCPCDGCNVVDAATTRRDRDLSPGRSNPEGVQFPVDLRLHVWEGA